LKCGTTAPALAPSSRSTGAIELDGRVYLVEMKWWSEPLGRGEVASHLVRIFNRGEVGGILISNSPYHPSAVADCKDALTKKTVMLVELRRSFRR
jgi:restriction system protein